MVIEVDILAVIIYTIGIFIIGLLSDCAFGMILERNMEVHQKDGK